MQEEGPASELRDIQDAPGVLNRIAGGIRFAFLVCRLSPLIVLLLCSKWPWSIIEQDENFSIRDEFL